MRKLLLVLSFFILAGSSVKLVPESPKQVTRIRVVLGINDPFDFTREYLAQSFETNLNKYLSESHSRNVSVKYKLQFSIGQEIKAQSPAMSAVTIGRNTTVLDTDPDGKQVFLVIGDSKAAGSNNTTGPGPTPTAGTVFQWDKVNNQVIQVTNTDVLCADCDPGQGTPWPQFGITYYNNSGGINEPVIVPMANPGARFSPDGVNNDDFSPTGAHYAPAVTEARDCLAALGLSRLKGIHVVLGINDARYSDAAIPLPTVYLWMENLVGRLIADFPGVPIIFTQIGRYETQAFNNRLYGMRDKLIQIARTYDDVYIAGAEASLISGGGYGADNLHWNITGCNMIGNNHAEWYSNGLYSKWARSVISSLHEVPSSTQKGLIANYVDSQVNNGSYWTMEYWGVHMTNENNSIYVDWTFRGYLLNTTSATYTTDCCINTNGTSTHYVFTFTPTTSIANASQDNFIIGSKISTRNTAQGTSASLLGGGNTATTIISMAQSTTPNLSYRANDITLGTNATDLAFQAGNFYFTGRDPNEVTNKRKFFKNSTLLTSDAVVSSGLGNQIMALGALNNNGTITSRISGSFQITIAARYTGFDLSTFVTESNTFLAGFP